MYYDILRCKAIDIDTLKLRGLEHVPPDMLRSLGIYPLLHADAFHYNPYTQYCTKDYVPLGDSYLSRPQIHDIVDPEQLADLLQKFKAQRYKDFMAVFAALEKRAQRPQTALLTAMLAGDSPPEADADLLWQVEAVQQENRSLWAQLKAARTWNEAHKVRPWLPWPDHSEEDCPCV